MLICFYNVFIKSFHFEVLAEGETLLESLVLLIKVHVIEINDKWKCPLIQALVQDEGHYWSNAGAEASITIAYGP